MTLRPFRSFLGKKAPRRSARKNQVHRDQSRKMLTQQLEDRRLLAGPELIAIRPDAGALLQSGDTLNIAPREFNLLFKGGADLAESTINANSVRLVRSGGDGTFGDGNEQQIALGYVGLDEPGSTDPDALQRIVFRTASSASHNPTDDLTDPAAVLNSFPDDTYRIEIIGAGGNALENNAGEAFNNGVNYALPFTLDRGPQIVAVVPQPIERTPVGVGVNARQTLVQHSDKIVVYFDNQVLDQDDAEDPRFYRLIDTSTTIAAGDDVTLIPKSAVYDPTANSVTLTFDSDLPEGTYRLDVGYAVDGNVANNGDVQVGSLFSDSASTSSGVSSGFVVNSFLGDQNGSNNDLNDVDTYALRVENAGATINAQVKPQPGLAVKVSLLDSTGALVGVPVSGVDGATVLLSTAVAAIGTYTVKIESNGGTRGTGSYVLNTNLAAAGLVINDNNSDVANATKLGLLGAAGIKVSSTIQPQGALGITLPPYPGGNDEPGHREIQREAHINSTGTTLTSPTAITTRGYYFPDNIGTNSVGQPFPNLITEEEKRIVRGLFDVLAKVSGFEFVETTNSGGGGTSIGVGDLRAIDPTLSPTAVAGKGGPSQVVVDRATYPGQSEYGDGFTDTMLHEILHALDLTHAYDLPAVMSDIPLPNDVLPGDHDVVHLQRIVPPNSTDVDLYQFELQESGKWSAETVAERLETSPSKLDSVLTLYRRNDSDPNKYDLIARNDRYYGNDSFLELELGPGTYFVGVTSTGNDQWDPKVPNSGYGGTTDGAYELKLSFEADRGDAGLRDANGTPLDGDGDGAPGGVHSFWFQASDQASTIFVDRTNDNNLSSPDGDGSIGNPIDEIDAAIDLAKNRIVVPKDAGTKIVAGDSFTVNDGVNPVATFTFGSGAGEIAFAGLTPSQIAANIAGAINTSAAGTALSSSVNAAIGASGRVVQISGVDLIDVEGTETLINAPNLIRVVGNGGLDGDISTSGDNVPYLVGVKSDNSALRDGRDLLVPQGTTLMIDAGALIKLRKANIDIGTSSINISRAGSAIQVLGTPEDPVYMRSYNNDAFGGDSNGNGSAGPGDFGGVVIRDDSDLEDRGIYLNYVNHLDINNGGGKVFVDADELTFTPIHVTGARPTISFNHISNSQNAAISASPNSFDDSMGRIGPDIHGNFLVQNKIDGLNVRVNISNGSPIERLTVPGRFDDSDIAHVLTQSLIISGNPGGFETNASGALTARAAGRLMIDPGVVVKLSNARIEAERGASAVIAEGTENRPIVFTSLFDDRFGGSGTFNTDGGASSTGTAGDWAGLFFGEVSSGNIDHALISFAGGDSPIEGGSANFNPIEVHQAELRIANSVIKDNAANVNGTRNGRGASQAATIYVRGAQPIIVNNMIVDNAGTAISINANALRFETQVDAGRSTGGIARYSQFDDNSGPLVRLNQMDNNETNGMTVRGEFLTTETIWDDTDIVHVLRSEITVDNHHTYSGLTLQSSNFESLVVKLFDNNAGFTATGTPIETIDRIGGTIHVLGTPGHPVVLTSLMDDTIGAGFAPDGTVLKNTNNSPNPTVGSAGDWRGFKFDEWSNDRNVAVVRERENPLTGGRDVNGNRDNAQPLGALARDEKSADENDRVGFEVNGFISPDDPNDVDVYSFTGRVGTPIWIDIDRTDTALDAIVEVVNSVGTVVARSVSSSNLANPGNVNALPLTQNPLLGGDFYTQNFRDPGMYFELPGTPGSDGIFFVRVRSAPRGANAALIDGQSSGKYQLQIRGRQVDEFPGSTVQFADIRDAITAIDVRGLPAHSQLVAEAGEIEGIGDTFASAQNLVNLLETDLAAIGLSGRLSNDTDVDWYKFNLEHTGIQVIAGVNDAPGTVAIVLDLDYADQALRADTTVAVYDDSGRLIYVSREGDIEDDQPVGAGPTLDDLSRGSLGDKDPYIGPIHITPVAGVDNHYYVAVMSNRNLPTSLMGAFQGDMTNDANRLVRLEPVNSVTRIVEDHIGFQGYRSQGGVIEPMVAQGILDISSELSLENHVKPFDLSNVVTYVITDAPGDSIGDDLYTASIREAQNYLTKVRDNISAGNDDFQDLVVRSDGAMFAYRRLSNGNGSVGQLVQLRNNDSVPVTEPNYGQLIEDNSQNDNIAGDGVTPNVNVYNAFTVPDRAEQFTTSDDVDAVTFQRRGDTGTSSPDPFYSVYYSVRESDTTSKLYRGRENGDATPLNATGGNPRYGYLGDIQPAGVTFATLEWTVRDRATPNNNVSTIRFESKLPGERGNDIRINVTYLQAGATSATVTNATSANSVNPTISLTLRYTVDNNGVINGMPTAGDIADAINNDTGTGTIARDLLTAVVTGGNSGTQALSGIPTTGFPVALTGGQDGAVGPLAGRVTGLSYNNFSSTGNLYGVTNAGEFLEINPDNGQVLNVRVIYDSAGQPFNFQGLSLGPQNVSDGVDSSTRGIYKNTMFAVTNSAQIIALDRAGDPIFAFDSNNSSQLITVTGSPDNDSYFTLTFDRNGNRQTTEPIKSDAPYTASVNEKQTISTVAYGGDFTLTFEKNQGAASALLTAITTAPAPGTVENIQVQNVSDQAFTEQWPATPFVIQVGSEQMLVTNMAGNTFTVERGFHGTATAAHPDTTSVYEVVTSILQTSMTQTASSPLTLSELLTVSTPLTISSPLTNTISSSILRLTVDDISAFPAAPFTIRVNNEQMLVSAVNIAAKELTITRGENSTTAAQHLAGSQVQVVPPQIGGLFGIDNQATSTTLRVVDASVFPTLPFSIQLDAEEMTVTGIDPATNELTVVRAENGTAIANHNIGASVRVLPIAGTTVGASITPTATVFEVVDAGTYPTAPFTIRVADEEMRVTAVDTTLNLLTVTRAQNGTVAATHVLGSPVQIIPTPGTGFPAMDALQTTLRVVDVDEFPPTTPFNIRIGDEVMVVTAVDPILDELTVTRGALGTSATTHALADPVEVLLAQSSALTVEIDNSQFSNTMTVFDATVFPATPFTIRVNEEEMLVTAVNTTTNELTVVRGRNGTAIDFHYVPQVAEVVSDTLTVVSDAPFPTVTPFNIRIGDEDLRVISRTGNQFDVIRAINGTQRAEHLTGELVRNIQTTAPIPYNATVDQVRAALVGLQEIQTGDITISPFDGPLTGDASGSITIEFTNNLGKKDLLPLTTDPTGLRANELQQITLDPAIESGTFVLRFAGLNTAPIAYDATAADVQSALEALPNIGRGNVVVTGGDLPGTPLLVEFDETLRNQNILSLISIPPATELLENNERLRLTLTGGPTGGNFRINASGGGLTGSSGDIAWNANAAAVQSALENINGIAAGDVVVTALSGTNLPGAVFQIEFVNGLADTDVADLTTSDTLTGGTGPNAALTVLVQGDVKPATVTVLDGSAVSATITPEVDGVRSVRDAIVGLTNIGDTEVQVVGDLQGAGVVVQFTGGLGAADWPLLQVDNAQMTGGIVSVSENGVVGDGVPDAFISGVTGLDASPRGIAFSPLDFNLWHVTTRRGNDAGHGVNAAADGSRNPGSEAITVTNPGDQPDRTRSEANGGASFYFGFEQWVQNPNSNTNSYVTYQGGTNAQMGILNTLQHADLSSNPDIVKAGGTGTYNFLGGALGSLETNGFSLASAKPTDRPTLYFNYFLETENDDGARDDNNANDPFRDSARVFASRDNGVTWELLATNNSTLSAASPNGAKAELPGFLSHLSDAGLNASVERVESHQLIQEMHDNTGVWRQARIDLSTFAGETNEIRLRFDFSTAGAMNDASLRDGIGRSLEANFGEYRNDNRSIGSLSNHFEGFYIDDIIVGYAERGEMVTGAPVDTSITDLNQGRTNDPDTSQPDILNGPYQIEIRRTGEYAAMDEAGISIATTFNTNDRHVVEPSEVSLQDFESGFTPWAPPAAGYELLGTNIPAFAIVPWSVTSNMPFAGSNSLQSGVIAGTQPVSIYEATTADLGGTTGAGVIQFTFKVDSVEDEYGLRFFIDGRPQTLLPTASDENTVVRDLTFASGDLGYRTISIPFSSGAHTFTWVHMPANGTVGIGGAGSAYIDNIALLQGGTGLLADRNRERVQGMFIIDSNIIRNSSTVGINVQPGTAQGQGGGLPHQGSTVNFAQPDSKRLIPGVVIQNNIVTGASAIRFAGSNGVDPSLPVPFGRIVNNTLVGDGPAAGTGVAVVGYASPTIMNNIITGFNLGIADPQISNVDVIVRSNYFQGNNYNGATGTDSQIAASGTPLFVDAANDNYYLVDTSVALDSSLDQLEDRFDFVNFKNRLGLAASNIDSPDRDVFGQLRINSSNNPGGGGTSVFKDRGAVDRSDFDQPFAELTVPVDFLNIDREDADPNATVVHLKQPIVNNFSILLNDGQGINAPFEGTGINPATVNSSTVTVRRNNVTLVEGVDYTLGYNEYTGELRLTPFSSLWEPAGVYEIILDNNVIADNAGNLLLNNQADGTTKFTIILPEVPLDFGDAKLSGSANVYGTLLVNDGARHAIINDASPRLGSYVDSENDSALLAGGLDDTPATVVAISPSASAIFDIQPHATAVGGTTIRIDSIINPPMAGDVISIDIGRVAKQFELVPAGIAPGVGNIAVRFSASDTADQIAAKLIAKINEEMNAAGESLVVQTVAGSPDTIEIFNRDDEDGVNVGRYNDGTTNYIVFLKPGVTGTTTNKEDILGFLNPQDPTGAQIPVSVTGTGYVSAWIDFDGNGVFHPTLEKVIDNVLISDAANPTIFNVVTPAGTTDKLTWARFRISPEGGLQPTGLAVGGEVEDYQVQIYNAPLPVPVDDPASPSTLYTINEDSTLDTNDSPNVIPSVLDNDVISPLVFTPVTVILDQDVANGTLVLDSATGNFVYTPNSDFVGIDTFTYRLATQQSAIDTALPSTLYGTVTIEVQPVNDAPQAVDQTIVLLEDTTRTVLESELLANATADAVPSYPVGAPTSPWDESGQVLHVVSLHVGTTTINAATPIGDFPIATSRGEILSATFDTSDPANPFLVSFEYRANEDLNRDNLRLPAGPAIFDEITYTISDDGKSDDPNVLGDGGTDDEIGVLDPVNGRLTHTAKISFDVRPQNDDPIANDDAISKTSTRWMSYWSGQGLPMPVPTEDQSLTIPIEFLLSNDVNARSTAADELADLNDGSLVIPDPGTVLTTTLGGTVTFNNDGTFTYRAPDHFYGEDTFTYTAQDVGINEDVSGNRVNGFLTDTAVVTIFVEPINDNPVAFPRELLVDEVVEYDAFGNLVNNDRKVAFDAEFLLQQFGVNPVLPGSPDTGLIAPYDESNQTLRVVAFTDADETVDVQTDLAASGGTGTLTMTTPSGGVLSFNFNAFAFVDGYYEPAVDYNGLAPHEADPLNPLEFFNYIVSDDGTVVLPPVPPGTAYTPDPFVEARSLPTRVSLTVADKNDAPEFPAFATVTFPEDIQADGTAVYYDIYAGARIANYDPLTPRPTVIFPGLSTARDERATESLSFSYVTTFEPAGMFSATPVLDQFGVLTLKPNPDAFGYAVFEITATDNGQSFNATTGLYEDDFRSTTRTLTVHITPVNDQPVTQDRALTVAEVVDTDPLTGLPNGNQAILPILPEDLLRQSTVNDPAILTQQPSRESDFADGSQSIYDEHEQDLRVVVFGIPNGFGGFTTVTAADSGTVFTTINGGTLMFNFDASGAFSGGEYRPAVDYNRLPPFNPTELFTYIVEDFGATTIPGADQVTPAAQSPIDYTAVPDPFGNVNNRSVAKTVQITVTEVNDPPFIPDFDTGATIVDGTLIDYTPNSISFDERERTDAPSMTFDLYQITGVEIKPGPLTALDELASQSLTSIIIQPAVDLSGNSLVPAGMMATNPILTADGRITISPTPDAFGIGVFDVIVTDNGSGVAPNQNVSIRKLTIAINAVNDVPQAADQTLDLVIESVERDSNGDVITPVPVSSITFDKAQLLRNAVPGVFAPTLNPSFNESEQELRVVAFRIPGVPAMVDALVDEPGLSGGNGTVTRTTLTNATLSFTFAGGEFVSGTYTPSVDYNRRTPFAAEDQFEFKIEDRGLVTIPGSNPLVTEDTGSLRSAYANATITTIEQNDPPEFNFQPVVNVLERDDNGETVVPNWATDIQAGPSTALDELERESVQFTLVPALSTIPQGLFRLPPKVANNGTLSVFPSPDAVGTATIVIEATDLDPSTPGFVSASHFVTFTLNVQPVNDAPRLNPAVINTSDVSVTDPDLSYSVGTDGTITYTLREDNTQPGGNATTAYFIPLVQGAVPSPNGFDSLGLLDVFNVGPANEATGAPGGSQILQLASFPRTTQRGGSLSEVFQNGQRVGLNYTPPINYNSAIGADDGFTYSVNDNSIVNGDPTAGETYSLTQGTLFEDQRSAVNRVRLRMSPVNDRPEFETSTLSVESAEDAGLVTKNGFAFNITGGPRTTATDESVQTLTFDVQPVGNANTFFTTAPTISPTGRLTYQAAADVFGAFEFTVVLRDNGAVQTATRGDLFESVPVTMTINVRPVNDAPVPVNNAPNLIYQVGEDGSVVIPFVGNAADNPGLLDFFRVGPSNETSALVGGGQSIDVATPYPATSVGGGSLVPVLDGNNVVIGLRYTPTINFAGTDKFTYTITDDGVTVALGSGGVATNDFKSVTNEVTISVISVNDPPQFSGGGDVNSVEDQGPVVVPNWATAVQAGPDDAIDELQGDGTNPAQTVSFVLNQISGSPSLFAVPPTVTISGSTASLSYTTADDANGDATFEVTLQDNGTPSQSVTKTFTISVAPVNDAPTFTPGGIVNVDEDSDVYSEVWATNISQGPADETGPPVRFEVTVPTASQGLFETLPTIDSNGVLRFKPAENASGSASLQVTAFDSQDAASAVATLQINIGEINDRPVAVSDQLDTDEDAIVLIDSIDLTENDVDPDLASNPLETLTVVLPASSTTQLGARLTYDSVSGQITYDPTLAEALQRMKPGDVLVDTFLYSVRDASGAESDPVEVTVTVQGVNDAPVLTPDTVVVNATGTTQFRPQDNDVDVDGTIVPTSIVITSQPTSGSLSIEEDGTLVYTPFASFNGQDQFRYTVADNLGQQSQQATVILTISRQPIVPDFEDVIATSKDTTIVDVGAAAQAVEGQLDLTSLSIVSGPANGTATANADGTISYRANAGHLGPDSIQVTITDSAGRVSEPATIQFNVVAFRLQNPNPSLFSDVNGSGTVTTLDALLIINRIGLAPNNTSSIPVTAADRGPLYFDVNGDDMISALDALQVINQLSLQGSPAVSEDARGQGSAEQVPLLSSLAQSAVSQSSTFDVAPPVETIETPAKVVDSSLPNREPKDFLDLIAESHEATEGDENEERLSALDVAFADLL
ncbi:tandem-95 repeat protein [Novipirellula caenicola]|uniref:Cadherin domain-containing protein n=1 Tax=Novipirellula caenicola TaxID=1536901 RepID=A0ABP9VMU1_9BACT